MKNKSIIITMTIMLFVYLIGCLFVSAIKERDKKMFQAGVYTGRIHAYQEMEDKKKEIPGG